MTDELHIILNNGSQLLVTNLLADYLQWLNKCMLSSMIEMTVIIIHNLTL